MTTNPHDQTLIFLHLPKTGGISVCQALCSQFAPHQVFHIRSGRHSGAPVFSPHHGPLESFIEMPADRKAQFRCVLGHQSYGLHEHLPGPASYFTILRQPLERYLSQVGQYNKMRASGEIKADGGAVTPEEFGDIQPRQLNNPQTCWLSGIDKKEFQSRDLTEVVEQVKQQLRENFRAVGILEQIDASMAKLASASGWPGIRITKENTGKQRPKREQVDEHFLARFEKVNWADQALYDFVKDLHFKKPTVRRFGLTQWLGWKKAA